MIYSTTELIPKSDTGLFQSLAVDLRRATSVVPALAQESDELSSSPNDRARLANESYKNRRARDGLFAAELFADPAWDILIALYCAAHSQQRLNVSSVCESAAVPPTTALRWIDRLRRLGLIQRLRNPMDGRVTWLALTDQAMRPLELYFDRIVAKLAPRRLAPGA